MWAWMMGMPWQEWANMWPYWSVCILFIPKTFPRSFIKVWSWPTDIVGHDLMNQTRDIFCILDPIIRTAPLTFDLFALFLENRIFLQTCGFYRMIENNNIFHFKPKDVHINGQNFRQNGENLIFEIPCFRRFLGKSCTEYFIVLRK